MSAVYRRDDPRKRRVIEINQAIIDAMRYQRKLLKQKEKGHALDCRISTKIKDNLFKNEREE
jgi:hypothetical protein